MYDWSLLFIARTSISKSTLAMVRLGFRSGSPWFFMQTIARTRSAATRAMISLADTFVNVTRPSRRNLTRWRNGRLCGVLFTDRLYPQHKTLFVESFDLYSRRVTERQSDRSLCDPWGNLELQFDRLSSRRYSL